MNQNPIQLTLKIQELHFHWYGRKAVKSRLCVATPSRAKPREVTAESWCAQIVETAQASWNQHLAIPWSFWPKGKPDSQFSTEAGEQRCFDVVDVFCGFEDYHDGTPADSIREIIDCLARGEDVLILSNSKKISGFILAVLMRLLDPDRHIIKLWWPIIHGGYDLSPFQLGYLYGLTDADRYPLPGSLSSPWEDGSESLDDKDELQSTSA